MNRTDIGTFYQGQLIILNLTPGDDATEEQITILKEKDVYLGVFKDSTGYKNIFSTTDETLVRTIDSEGNVSFKATITPLVSKAWLGDYKVELLIRASDNSYSSPCENILTFRVERRKLSDVITSSES